MQVSSFAIVLVLLPFIFLLTKHFGVAIANEPTVITLTAIDCRLQAAETD